MEQGAVIEAERGTVVAANLNGLMSAVVIDGTVIVSNAVIPGGPVVRDRYPLPPGTRVAAVGVNGLTIVTDTGEVLLYENGRWIRCYRAGGEETS